MINDSNIRTQEKVSGKDTSQNKIFSSHTWARIRKDAPIVLLCLAVLLLSLINLGTVQDKVNACNEYWQEQLEQHNPIKVIWGDDGTTPQFNLTKYETDQEMKS